MDTKANYAVVGLFVIILTALMIFGFIWLSGFSNQQSYQTYLVYARGGVNGLNVDSPVLFNGVRVGSVSKIELDAPNPQFVKLFLKVEENIPINQSTVATLIAQGITGLVYVGLKEESAEAPVLVLESGQRYLIIPFEKPLLAQISEVLPELTKNLGDIAAKFKMLFNEQNLTNFSETLGHLNHVTQVLDEQSDMIRKSIISLNTLLKNSADASQYFKPILISAQQTLVSSQQMVAELNKVSRQIDLQVGNVGQQVLPGLEDLITRLNDTTTNLQQVSKDLAGNPAVLIRGKQPPSPGPGE